MTAMDLLQPAHQLRDALLERRFSARDLLDASLARIDELNPSLNAVVARDDMSACQMAAESDARLKNGTARPLEGLPITIKDAFDVAGLASSGGLPAYVSRVPTEDAAAVARLRAAGVVIIGKSNVPVFSGDFQSFNPVHGVTNNPWDLSRSPGGSSGAAAVAVATGMSAFELGSDLGSSIRWPCHATGVFGLKTSWNLVSTWGVLPPPPERRTLRNAELMVAGPIARSAADLAMVLAVIAGPRDSASPATALPPAHVNSAKGLRVALWADDRFAATDEAVSAGVSQAAAMLEKAGAIIERTARPGFRFAEAYETYALMNHAVVAYGLPPKVRARIQSMAAQYAPGDLSHRALQARGARMTPSLFQEIQQRRMAIKRQWARFFTRFDVVLCPPAPVLAIPHDHLPDLHGRVLQVNGENIPYLDFLVWASLATGSDLPAAVAPVGLSASGLPRGVQIIGASGDDLTVTAVAGLLENLGGGYKRPPATSL
jgi:amidase